VRARKSVAHGSPSPPRSTNPPVGVVPLADDAENSTQAKRPDPPEAARSRGAVVPVTLAVLAAVVVIVVWIRHH
ncbi:MAG TPA: hypothetical protein VE441_13630, partial [Mycobacterium sp.]|nr:hypothetical protein [Mycobacterium sp.]